MFRPYGVTPGHALEWTRLALQLWALGGAEARMAARRGARACSRRRSRKAGTRAAALYYTLE